MQRNTGEQGKSPPIIISVYDQKLLDSILGSHVKKDTILK